MATPEDLRREGEERGRTLADISDLEELADTDEKKSALVKGIAKGLGGGEDD